MAQVVRGNDVVQAWKAGAAAVLAAPTYRLRNLITEIEQPLQFQNDWMKKYTPQSVGESDSVSVVAKVLFPYHPKRPKQTRIDYYAHWQAVLARTRRSGRLEARWGTYFDRLVNFNGTENQIENIVVALSNWRMRPEAALVAHTSAPTLDTLRPMGSPCLQYLEILQSSNGTIDLTAVYRNHDFLNKALGNFIGLARILKFLATESGRTPGRLVCHSVRAYCERSTKLRTLVAR